MLCTQSRSPSSDMHCFVFPNTIITDLGYNFHSHEFWEFCENSYIEVKYVSVAYSRANGQVERTNGLILDGLKKRLYNENSKKGGKWIHELFSVVLGLRTQPSKATGQSLFFLSMGKKLSSLCTSCGSLQDWRCMKKAKLIRQDIWSLIRQKKSDATFFVTVSSLHTRYLMLPRLQRIGEVL
jgi:hypothetical protein